MSCHNLFHQKQRLHWLPNANENETNNIQNNMPNAKPSVVETQRGHIPPTLGLSLGTLDTNMMVSVMRNVRRKQSKAKQPNVRGLAFWRNIGYPIGHPPFWKLWICPCHTLLSQVCQAPIYKPGSATVTELLSKPSIISYILTFGSTLTVISESFCLTFLIPNIGMASILYSSNRLNQDGWTSIEWIKYTTCSTMNVHYW